MKTQRMMSNDEVNTLSQRDYIMSEMARKADDDVIYEEEAMLENSHGQLHATHKQQSASSKRKNKYNIVNMSAGGGGGLTTNAGLEFLNNQANYG